MTEVMDWADRFRRVIPKGSGTTSKTPKLLPDEPAVIVRGKGCRVWDDRGREFIDFRNALGPITLGYGFPAVDEAIREQLNSGIVFGHPHPLECEVAEMLCEIIPCAEQARFLKTGGEAMAAAIRIARAHTERDHVIQIGYNGWLNGLAAGGQILPGAASESYPVGVPAGLGELHHAATWNDPASVERWFEEYPGQIAAVTVACSYVEMDAGRTFLPFLREITERHGAALIFDEIVTGFRLALGGAQEYFNVTPDLAVFAKGMANGMPLSVYLGRREWMQACDRHSIITSTYAGETLSLAAAKATLATYLERDVIGCLWRTGETLWLQVQASIHRHRLPIELKGCWPCPQWVFEDEGRWTRDALAEAFFRAAYRHGVSLYQTSYVNFSHCDADVAETVSRLDAALAELAGS